MFNNTQFKPQTHQFLPSGHRFDRICREYGVEHRITKPAHPWTNGQSERLNRTIKEATMQHYPFPKHFFGNAVSEHLN